MKNRRDWFLLGLAIIAVGFMIVRDLNGSSPAERICQVARQHGDECRVVQSYEATVINTRNEMGQALYLVITDGNKVIAVLPIN